MRWSLPTIRRAAAVALICCVFSSCSIKKMAMNSIAGMIAPDAKSSGSAAGALLAFTSEDDPQLVADSFPIILKLVEAIMLESPDNAGLAVTAGQLYVMYANVFVQGPAEMLPASRFREQNAQYERAANFYRRGSGYALNGLDLRYKGFRERVFGANADDERDAALAQVKQEDAAALFWAASGALANFALSPLDPDASYGLESFVAMMERAADLDPSYFGGLILETLFNFYSAAPDFMGGGMDKAEAAFNRAVEMTGGSASLYTTYAKNICVPAQDSAGFDEAIAKALSVNPDDNPDSRLMTIIAQRRAAWLKSCRADLFLE